MATHATMLMEPCASAFLLLQKQQTGSYVFLSYFRSVQHHNVSVEQASFSLRLASIPLPWTTCCRATQRPQAEARKPHVHTTRSSDRCCLRPGWCCAAKSIHTCVSMPLRLCCCRQAEPFIVFYSIGTGGKISSRRMPRPREPNLGGSITSTCSLIFARIFSLFIMPLGGHRASYPTPTTATRQWLYL